MQAESSNSICPLCKSVYASGSGTVPGPTRLCPQCQKMVRTTLPSTSAPIDLAANTLAHRQAVPEPTAKSNGDSARQDFIEETRRTGNAPQTFQKLTTNPLEDTAAAAQRSANGSAEKNFPGYNGSADPWEEPLPSWEHSRNEYPVLLSPNGRKSRKRLWIAAAIIFVLVAAAVAGAVIFLKPSGTQETDSNAKASDKPQTSALISHGEVAEKPAPPPDAVEQPGSSNSPDANAQAASGQNPSEPAVADQNGSPQGPISLQAMSSPSEDEAKRFAEKLTRAGIPAYVAAAEIKGRGTWFRVRVGHFATAEEAKKYSTEYRQRARAAGINLELIVSGS
ncbi:MAG: SPOR domain-containing protein [Blastocatellia bacterium]|nr:SPOR domain-containing protein [Blastocatellia bacterium]